MKVTLVGSRYFGASVLHALQADRVDIAAVVAPSPDDRLAVAARAAGLAVHLMANPKLVPADAIAVGTGLIVAAHTHARVTPEALARAKLGGVGYHPSLLPRHRGIAAVEWTILEGDPVAGGTVYHLADRWDAGAIAAQDWCFVVKGETARELWERALAPLGLRLLAQVVRHARDAGSLPARPQDERFATRAPMIRKSVSLSEQPRDSTSLVVTVTGPDRPGIVRQISERARELGANWAGSRMASLAGHFAGMVRFEVPAANADALASALQALETQGIAVAISRTEAPPTPPGQRHVNLDLFAPDRPGIVRELSTRLVERGVSIHELRTEIVDDEGSAAHGFRVQARLAVPEGVSNDALRQALDALATAGMADIALDGK